MLKKNQVEAARLVASEEELTQKQIAQRVGVSEMSVSRWIRSPAFQQRVAEEKALSIRSNATSYIQGRLDGLILSAIDSLDLILRSGQSEQAKVRAAQYVLDRYASDLSASSSSDDDDDDLNELTDALRLID